MKNSFMTKSYKVYESSCLMASCLGIVSILEGVSACLCTYRYIYMVVEELSIVSEIIVLHILAHILQFKQ